MAYAMEIVDGPDADGWVTKPDGARRQLVGAPGQDWEIRTVHGRRQVWCFHTIAYVRWREALDVELAKWRR